ncbi:MAG: NYN domain-containing protein [Opitutales bacterium]
MSENRYLLIDAYNVIHATGSLRKLMSGQLDLARDQLAEMVRSIHDAEAIRVALILDSRKESPEVEHPYEVRSFEYLYAPAALTADGVIERIVKRVRDPSSVSVVSNDNMVREATRASGAMALRPEELFSWAQACEERLQQDTRRHNKKNQQVFRNGLDINLQL